MEGFQKNIIRSFRKAKEDMKNLQAQITDLNNRLEEVINEVSSLKDKKRDGKSSRKK